MSIKIEVPTLPESVTDATILGWHKQPGDNVSVDENLVDLETDKVVLEVPAPVDGVLTSIDYQSGDIVKSGDVLATIEPGKTTAKAPTSVPEPEVAAQPAPADDPVLTPAVRRLVKEMNLDPTRIKGTGKDGRLLKSDVMQYLDQQAQQRDPDIAAAQPVESTLLTGDNRVDQRVPMTRLRARIAERLVEAQQNAAILTTFNEVNLQAVSDLRAKYKDLFAKEHGVKLGFMSFFVAAVVESLRKFPVINASIDGSDTVYHNYYDIGIAVGAPRGLVVPILRDADTMNFAQIEQTIKEFGIKAREGGLTMEDLTGGTFTISNGGVYGSMLSTPILNPPQSAILGMHNIVERPVAEQGEVVIRPMMYLALSYDHRLIDGKEAVQFLVSIKEQLEDPTRLLLHL
ncbi:MAG: 2-oxoglutarate dehydrogenase complex dihydrolipoyllysine-residue succinyltransferase [bacterium]